MWIHLFFPLFIWKPYAWPVKTTSQLKVGCQWTVTLNPDNSACIETSNQFPNLPRTCTGMMLFQIFEPDPISNKVNSHANVPLSSAVTLKMVRVTFSEGIQLRLNLWPNGLIIPACPAPAGGTPPMSSPFRFKVKEMKNKPDDRLKFQLRGTFVVAKGSFVVFDA